MSDEPRYTAQLAPVSPTNTPATAPTVTDINLNVVTLWEMNIRIPPGHAGYTGIALVDSNQFVLPYALSGAAWLVGDDDDLTFPYGKELGANAALWSYNTSTDYQHGWQVRLVYSPIVVVEEEPPVIVTPDLATWLAEISGTGG